MDVVSTGIRGFTYEGVFPPCLPVSVFGGGVVAHECECTHVLMIVEVVSGICVRTFKMLTFRMGPKSGPPCPRISQVSTLRHSDHHVLMPSRPHMTVVLVTPWSGAGASRCACWCIATSGARAVDAPPLRVLGRRRPPCRCSERGSTPSKRTDERPIDAPVSPRDGRGDVRASAPIPGHAP